MTPEKALAIKAHAEAIAALLYEEADPEQLTTLAGTEKTVRDQLKRACHAPYWCFFIRTATGIESGRTRHLKSILGELPISSKTTQSYFW